MVIPVAAINIPANTKIASLARARAMAAAHARGNQPVDVERERYQRRNVVTIFRAKYTSRAETLVGIFKNLSGRSNLTVNRNFAYLYFADIRTFSE